MAGHEGPRALEPEDLRRMMEGSKAIPPTAAPYFTDTDNDPSNAITQPLRHPYPAAHFPNRTRRNNMLEKCLTILADTIRRIRPAFKL